jgi:hypothetical protein
VLEGFTDYKDLIKSRNPTVNVLERVEIPTQNLPNQNKRRRSRLTKDKTPKQHPRKQRKDTSKTVNANQHQVDRYQLDIENPNNMDIPHIHHIPSTNVYKNISARTSKNLDYDTLGNIEPSQRVNKISTNYIDFGESFNTIILILENHSIVKL